MQGQAFETISFWNEISTDTSHLISESRFRDRVVDILLFLSVSYFEICIVVHFNRVRLPYLQYLVRY